MTYSIKGADELARIVRALLVVGRHCERVEGTGLDAQPAEHAQSGVNVEGGGPALLALALGDDVNALVRARLHAAHASRTAKLPGLAVGDEREVATVARARRIVLLGLIGEGIAHRRLRPEEGDERNPEALADARGAGDDVGGEALARRLSLR